MSPTVRESASTSNSERCERERPLKPALKAHTAAGFLRVIMLALVNNEPKVLNILQMLEYYLDHQKDVVTEKNEVRLK